MSSKITIPLVLGLLVMFLFMSSEVAAKDLKEDVVARETNRVDDANLVGGGGGGGGGYGFGDGYPGGYGYGGFPGDYGYGGFPGGFPRGGFPRFFCRLGCCYRYPFTRQCLRCCP